MTDDITAGGRPPDDVLIMVEELLTDAAHDFWAVRQKVKAGEFERLKEAAGAVQELKKAFYLVLEERNKVDKLRKHAAGVGPERVLDLDAARDEVGRRLARLRDAGDGG